jgi:hypothetical protein
MASQELVTPVKTGVQSFSNYPKNTEFRLLRKRRSGPISDIFANSSIWRSYID